MPISNSKVSNIASIRCMAFNTTIKAFWFKITSIPRRIRLLLNKVFLFRIMMNYFRFVHFLLDWLVTCLNKDCLA